MNSDTPFHRPIDPAATDRRLHICFVTDDMESFSAWLAALLASEAPPIHSSPAPEIARATYRGQATDATFRQAFLRWGETEIEIIEPGPEPSSWREFLEERGPGIHHLGFTVPDLDGTASDLEAQGCPVVHGGHYPGGRYVYADTAPRLGTLIELLEFEGGPFEGAPSAPGA